MIMAPTLAEQAALRFSRRSSKRRGNGEAVLDSAVHNIQGTAVQGPAWVGRQAASSSADRHPGSGLLPGGDLRLAVAVDGVGERQRARSLCRRELAAAGRLHRLAP